MIVTLEPAAPVITNCCEAFAATDPSSMRLPPAVYDMVTAAVRLFVTETRKLPTESLPTSTPRMLAHPVTTIARTSKINFLTSTP